MESLRVLSLTGNSVISKIHNYRKTLTIKCVSLTAILNNVWSVLIKYSMYHQGSCLCLNL